MSAGFLWEGTITGAGDWKGIMPDPPPSEPIVMLERHLVPGYTTPPSKEQILAAVANPKYSFMALSTHGSIVTLTTFDPDPKKPFKVKWVSIYDKEFKKAMTHRPPFRLVIINACYSADGEWDEIFTHDYRKMSAIIANTGEAISRVTHNRITRFIELISEPANSGRALSELLDEAKNDGWSNPESPLYSDDPHYFGDSRMKPGDIFRPWEVADYDEDNDGKIRVGEALRAIQDYFNRGLPKTVALEVINRFFSGRGRQ